MSDNNCRDLVDQAWELVERGDLINAQASFTRVCELDAEDAEAWMMVGTICGELGQLAEATDNLEKALKVDPAYADAYLALAKIQFSAGTIDAALDNARKATELDADYAEAWATLGSIFARTGEYGAARTAAIKAIAINPQLVDAHMSLGIALEADGKTAEATDHYQQVLGSTPDRWEAHFSLGKIMQAAGDTEAAIQHYQAVTRLCPGNAEAHALTGMLLLQQDKLPDAKTCIEHALEIQADLPVAIFHHGLIAYREKDYSEAVSSFRQLLEIDPDNVETHINLGMALHINYRLDEARQVYENLMELLPATPGNAIENWQLANTYYNFAIVLRCQGMTEESVAAYREALKVKPDFVLAGSSLLQTLHYLPAADPEKIYQEHIQWSRAHASQAQRETPTHNDSITRRLRIGYISPDFRKHSVAYFFEPLLRYHNTNEFEIYCYSDVKSPDEITDRFRGMAEHWRSTRDLDTDSLASKITEDRIDILVDLTGHTEGNRLQVFAQRPAPIQITYLGYPDTTGLSTIDYRITDEHADPSGVADTLHSETLLRLPRPFLCYAPPESVPILPPPVQEKGYITFGSFNNLAKINSEVIDVWSHILNKVPESRLLLKNFFLADQGTCERYYRLFQQHGIERSRIELHGPVAKIDTHLDFYNKIDIALDTFPYNGTTTTCEALWMSVPVITKTGNMHAGRVGVSLLNGVDMDDFIAADNNDYVSKACKLAEDPDRIAKLGGLLHDSFLKSRLCNGEDLSRSIETAYLEIWKTPDPRATGE